MDAKEYIITSARMCDTIHNCSRCLFRDDYICPTKIDIYNAKYADLMVRKVEQWGKANPLPLKVIRQDRMLKRFPYAPLDKDGVIEQCPDYPTYGFSSARCKKYNNDCYACRKEYWLEEVDE